MWHAEPAKVADNLYFLGTKIHSAWALAGSEGIIVIEALFDYAAKDEILDGLKKVGLDPGKVKYVILSHAHGDHDGGAKLLQDSIPGVHLIYGAEDWDSIDKLENRPGGKPKRDMVGDDGMRVSVGDASVRIVTTPGHTPGTLSYLFEVRDNGKPLRVAYVGGTAIPFNADGAYYDRYLASSNKMAKAAAVTAQPCCCRITPNSTMPTSKRILPPAANQESGIHSRWVPMEWPATSRWSRPARRG
jgi:metallo-beta-lactamase class B